MQVFSYFNLCELIRHFDWLPGLIRAPDQKKLKIFQLFIIRPATSPDQSEPKISTDGACADIVLIRSSPFRCLFSGVEISLKLDYLSYIPWYRMKCDWYQFIEHEDDFAVKTSFISLFACLNSIFVRWY